MTQSITLLIVLFFLAAVMQLLVALLKKSKNADAKAGGGALRYQTRGRLMSLAELQFFRALEAAVGDAYRVFSKVRLADIIQPAQSRDRSTWYSAFGSISSKHVDFVVCDPETMEFRLAVELDDKSHARDDRAERDLKVDAILSQAGIPAIHVPARASYSVQEIQERLFAQPPTTSA